MEHSFLQEYLQKESDEQYDNEPWNWMAIDSYVILYIDLLSSYLNWVVLAWNVSIDVPDSYILEFELKRIWIEKD